MQNTTAELRKHPRYVTRFPSRFRSPQIPTAEGEVINLSVKGCCIRSKAEVKPGASLRVQIQASAKEPPIEIEQAIVHWQLPLFIGVEFLAISPEDTLRLQKVIAQFEQSSARVVP